MADEKTPNRRLPLPDPNHAAVTDASRLAEALRLIDNDLAVLLGKATFEALGRVVLGTAASIAEGDTETVPTSEAVQQHVSDAISELIGSAPGVLDTLAAMAEALGNDPNFATTITSLIATKADKEATATSLNAKADKAAVDQAVNDINGALAATNNTVATKAATTWAQSLFDNRYTKAETNSLLNAKRTVNDNVLLPDTNNYLNIYGGRLQVVVGGDPVFSVQSDGNVWSKMFGHMSTWVDGKRDAAITAAKSWASANLVSDIRQAGGAYAVGSAGGSAGEVVHRVQQSGTTLTVETKYLQKMVNGSWYTITKA